MSNKKINRRDFFLKLSQYLLTFFVIGRGVERGLASAQVRVYQSTTKDNTFTDDEFKIIKSIASIIIPTDGNPGANEAGIAEYLVEVFQQQGTKTIEAIKAFLGIVNTQANQLFSASYNGLSQPQKEKLVGIIATTPQFAPIWRQIRALTVLRFYTLPEGYKPPGLPGPNVDRGGFPSVRCKVKPH
jgi:hypothetical protein